jgi:hypothetical protein
MYILVSRRIRTRKIKGGVLAVTGDESRSGRCTDFIVTHEVPNFRLIKGPSFELDTAHHRRIQSMPTGGAV